MLDALLERVETEEDADQELLALLEGSRALRVAAYERALQWGPDGPGLGRALLCGELQRLGEDEDDVLELADALRAAGSLRHAGLCAEPAAAALERMEDGRDLVDGFATSCDPGDELQAVLILTLLAGAHGDVLRRHAARAVATLLSAGDEPNAEFELEVVDPEMIRGALDAMQLTYQDVTGSRWKVRIPYRDEFEQRQRLEVDLALTGRSVLLRATGLLGDSDALLAFNHTAGLARFSRDLNGEVSITAEVDRRGFAFEVLERAVADFTAAVERVMGIGLG